MENITAQFKSMMNNFTDADGLMKFAATWGIADLLAVRFRHFRVRNREYGDEFVIEQMDLTDYWLSMARAIDVSLAKLNRCTPEEWNEITKNTFHITIFT